MVAVDRWANNPRPQIDGPLTRRLSRESGEALERTPSDVRVTTGDDWEPQADGRYSIRRTREQRPGQDNPELSSPRPPRVGQQGPYASERIAPRYQGPAEPSVGARGSNAVQRELTEEQTVFRIYQQEHAISPRLASARLEFEDTFYRLLMSRRGLNWFERQYSPQEYVIRRRYVEHTIRAMAKDTGRHADSEQFTHAILDMMKSESLKLFTKDGYAKPADINILSKVEALRWIEDNQELLAVVRAFIMDAATLPDHEIDPTIAQRARKIREQALWSASSKRHVASTFHPKTWGKSSY